MRTGCSRAVATLVTEPAQSAPAHTLWSTPEGGEGLLQRGVPRLRHRHPVAQRAPLADDFGAAVTLNLELVFTLDLVCERTGA